MITVSAFGMNRHTSVAGSATVVDLRLNESEQEMLDFLDADTEEAAAKSAGTFEALLDLDRVPMSVIAALKKRWESGGWVVSAFRRQQDAGVVVQLVFAAPPPTFAQAKPFVPAALTKIVPPVVAGPSAALSVAPRLTRPLLLRMPTRGRPHQAIATLEAYRALAADQHLPIEVVIDEDDESMNDSRVLQRLVEMECFLCIGRHGSKVAAVNGGRQTDWQILAPISDDMVPVVPNYDTIWIDTLRQHFPLLDGAVYFDDGYNSRHVDPNVRNGLVLCTLPIIGRHLYDQFGYVYYHDYGSIYCDDEQTETWTAMNRLRYVPQMLVEHRHHAAGKASMDAVYARNDNTFGTADERLYRERRAMRFYMPKIVLSILICTTPARQHMLTRLVEWLRYQMRPYRRQVEIVVNGESVTTGEKRVALLQAARGEYVAFVDDDDWVAHNYVARILTAINSTLGCDCVELHGILTENGDNPQPFHHSLVHDKWETKDGVHLRYPNHLNAVRRELALAAGFPAVSYVEDRAYSDALKPMLKVEAPCGPEPLYHYWYRSQSSGGK